MNPEPAAAAVPEAQAPETDAPKGRRIPRGVSILEILLILCLFCVFAGYIPLRMGILERIIAGAALAASLVASGAIHDDSLPRMGFSWPGSLRAFRWSAALCCWTAVLAGIPTTLSVLPPADPVPPLYDALVRYPLLAAVFSFAVFSVASNRFEDIFRRPVPAALGTGGMLAFAFAHSVPAALVFGGIGLVGVPVFRRSSCLLPATIALWFAMLLARVLWPEAWHSNFRFGT